MAPGQAFDFLSNWPVLIPIGLVLVASQALYILVTCVVLRLVGVSKPKTSEWALKHAGRFRAVELIRAWKTPSPDKAPDTPVEAGDSNDASSTDRPRAVS